MKRSSHLGNPCIYCDQEWDAVAVGPCPGRPRLDMEADLQLTLDAALRMVDELREAYEEADDE